MASGASTGGGSKSDLQRGLAFYRGSTITYVDYATPGSGPDQLYRAEAQYLATYLHATVNVEDVPGGNTYPGQDVIAGARPDGLTIGSLSVIGDMGQVLLHQPGVNFNPERMEYIGANGPSDSLIVANTSSPYKTLDSINVPNPPRFLMQNSGPAQVQIPSLLGVAGFHVNFVPGYSSISLYLQGFVRGDGPIMVSALGTLYPLISGGQARVLWASFVPPVGTLGRAYTLGVATTKSVEKEYPAKTKEKKAQYAAVNALLEMGSPLVTQTSVDGYKLAALRAAFAWEFKQPAFHEQLLQTGNNPTYVNPIAAKNIYITALKYGPLVEKYFSQF